MNESRVLIVIVNYKTGNLVVNCLASLEAELAAFPNAHVTVVDNPSGDDSVGIIRTAISERGWETWVTLIRSAVNGGFSYGNNRAIKPALASSTPPDLIWLLNPDTTAKPNALGALVAFLNDHAQVGIVGSSLEAVDGTPWPYAFRFPNFWNELDQGLGLGVVTRLLQKHSLVRTMSDVPEKVDWLPGASMLVRRTVFDAIGLMDEEYFLYYEETDFCLAAAQAGFECWYVPASRVMHIAGQSTGVTNKKDVPQRLPAYWFESRTRYFIKNHGRLYGAATDVARALAYIAWRGRRRIQSKRDDDPPHYLGDFLQHSSIVTAQAPGNTRIPKP